MSSLPSTLTMPKRCAASHPSAIRCNQAQSDAIRCNSGNEMKSEGTARHVSPVGRSGGRQKGVRQYRVAIRFEWVAIEWGSPAPHSSAHAMPLG